MSAENFPHGGKNIPVTQCYGRCYRSGVDFLYHLLAYAQGIFHNVETTDPLNLEAAKL